MNLPLIDIAIILGFMAASVALGVWLGRGNRTADDYSLGGRNMPWWALLGSIVATVTSTATFLSVTGIPVFENGNCRFLQLAFGYVIGRVLVSVVLMPQYFRGQLMTAYEVLAKRFGTGARRTASLLFLITRNLGDGLRLYLCAIALNFALGLSMSVAIVVIGVVTLVYTLFGGMRSVVWNDCIQFVVYMIGGIAALLLIANLVPGGFSTIVTQARTDERLTVFVTEPPSGTGWIGWLLTEPYSLYAGILGGMFLTFGTHGVDQMMVQRYLCARSQSDAAKAVVCSGFVVLLQFALFLFVGVALASFIRDFPPPEQAQQGDRVFAWFIVEHMPTGLRGLTLASVFAAAMSTLSSSLSSSATAVASDFSGSGKTSITTTRIWTVVFAVVQIVVATAAIYVSENVVGEALAIAGFVAGILLGVFLLGIISRRADQTTAIIAMFCGSLWLFVIHTLTPLAWIWYTAIGAAMVLVVGLVESATLPKLSDE